MIPLDLGNSRVHQVDEVELELVELEKGVRFAVTFPMGEDQLSRI